MEDHTTQNVVVNYLIEFKYENPVHFYAHYSTVWVSVTIVKEIWGVNTINLVIIYCIFFFVFGATELIPIPVSLLLTLANQANQWVCEDEENENGGEHHEIEREFPEASRTILCNTFHELVKVLDDLRVVVGLDDFDDRGVAAQGVRALDGHWWVNRAHFIGNFKAGLLDSFSDFLRQFIAIVGVAIFIQL